MITQGEIIMLLGKIKHVFPNAAFLYNPYSGEQEKKQRLPIFRRMKAAYGAGFRAGKAHPRLQRPGGTRGIKVIVPPACPYKEPHQVILRACWHTGMYDGLMKRLSKPAWNR